MSFRQVGPDHMSCVDPDCANAEYWVTSDGRVICADDECFAEYGRIAVAGILPPAAVLRAYMAAAGWAEQVPGGIAGSLWTKDDVRLGVPADDDAFMIQGAITRLAKAEGRPLAEVTCDVLAAADAPGPPESARETPPPLVADRVLPERDGQPGALTGTGGREALGRIFHEQGRLTVNAERAKPFGVGPWEERTPEQQEIDMRGAHAVAVYALTENALTYGISCGSCAAKLDRAHEEYERAERAEAKLAAIADLPPLYVGAVAEGNAVVSRPGILAIIGSEQIQERSDGKESP